MSRFALKPHPATPNAAVASLEVEILWGTGDALAFIYSLSGRISQIALPAPAGTDRTDDLWKHTCFEAFLRPDPGPSYTELNFSPSSAWAAYGFDSERTGMRAASLPSPPVITTERHVDRFELRAELRAPLDAPRLWHVGLTAVIEDIAGAKSYWALSHPREVPDFHHPGGFTLKLPRVGPT